MSHWHLALALAAGAISGVVTSKSGRVLVVKGDTHKEKTLQTEYTERDDGSVAETRILTDKFSAGHSCMGLDAGLAHVGRSADHPLIAVP